MNELMAKIFNSVSENKHPYDDWHLDLTSIKMKVYKKFLAGFKVECIMSKDLTITESGLELFTLSYRVTIDGELIHSISHRQKVIDEDDDNTTVEHSITIDLDRTDEPELDEVLIAIKLAL